MPAARLLQSQQALAVLCEARDGFGLPCGFRLRQKAFARAHQQGGVHGRYRCVRLVHRWYCQLR